MSTQTQVILLENVIGLGEEGDVRNVRAGYARNYLIPRGLAESASALAMSRLQSRMDEIESRRAERRTENASIYEKLNGLRIELKRRAGQSDKLFGSVNASDIIDMLAERDIEIDKRYLLLRRPIKTLGEHVVSVRLSTDHEADVVIAIAREGEAEAEALAEEELAAKEQITYGEAAQPQFVEEEEDDFILPGDQDAEAPAPSSESESADTAETEEATA